MGFKSFEATSFFDLFLFTSFSSSSISLLWRNITISGKYGEELAGF